MEENDKNKPPRTLDEFLNDDKRTVNLDNLSEETMENIKKGIEIEAERRIAPIKQKEELEKQTAILEEAKALTVKNAEYTKQIAEYTKRNEISSKRQFVASCIISIFALGVAIASFFKPIKIDEQQFNQLLNKTNKDTVSVSQIINYTEPSKTSKVTISRKLIHKNKR